MSHKRSNGCACEPAPDADVEADGCCTCRSTLPEGLDPRERHVVCKLERYELEDRHLRVLDELQTLKKHCNAQEDKIKRLATKLVRSGSAQVADERDRISLLQAENAKLRDKLCLLRTQLANNKIFARSPSRTRKLAAGEFRSAPITCRSESSRLKVPVNNSCACNNGNPPSKCEEHQQRIDELECEKKSMLGRIGELQGELASFACGSRREKVAENVEYIRVWRQMKRLNEKLLAANSANELLNEQIRHLKSTLEESNRNNEQMTVTLEAERKQLAKLDESMTKARSSQMDLKEKDERITDLLSELEILQQHNRELLELSSKFAKVEQENAQLKRKVTDQQSDQQSLKDAFNTEKANNSALEAANQQLLAKLSELQTSIDLMTVQLAAQNECKSRASQKKSKRSSSASTSEDKSAPRREPPKDDTGAGNKLGSDDARMDKSVQCEAKGTQTNGKLRLSDESTQTEKLLDYDSAKLNESAFVNKTLSGDNNKPKGQPQNGSNSLSREGMLKLLEQVQISSPLESQSASRVAATRHAETSSNVPVRMARPVSNLESFLFGESSL